MSEDFGEVEQIAASAEVAHCKRVAQSVGAEPDGSFRFQGTTVGFKGVSIPCYSLGSDVPEVLAFHNEIRDSTSFGWFTFGSY